MTSEGTVMPASTTYTSVPRKMLCSMVNAKRLVVPAGPIIRTNVDNVWESPFAEPKALRGDTAVRMTKMQPRKYDDMLR